MRKKWHQTLDRSLVSKWATEYRLPSNERYDIVSRDFDNKVEVIGYVQDPTKDMNDFRGREMLFRRDGSLGVFANTLKVSS